MKKNKKADFDVINTFCALSEYLEGTGVERFNNMVETLESGQSVSEWDEVILELSKYLHTTPILPAAVRTFSMISSTCACTSLWYRFVFSISPA